MAKRRNHRAHYGPPHRAIVQPPEQKQGIRLAEVDGRTAEGKKYYAVFGQLLDDLGGIDQVTMAQMATAQMAAALVVWTGNRVPHIVLGGEDGLSAFVTATNALNRHLMALGFKRELKEVEPVTMATIMQEYEEEKKPRKKKRPRLNDN